MTPYAPLYARGHQNINFLSVLSRHIYLNVPTFQVYQNEIVFICSEVFIVVLKQLWCQMLDCRNATSVDIITNQYVCPKLGLHARAQLRKVFNKKKCSHIVMKTSRAGIGCSTINI